MNKSRRSAFLLTTIVSSLVLIGCSSGSKIKVDSVSIDHTSMDVELGSKGLLKATVLPNNASTKEVSWISSNENVAKVDGGNITTSSIGKTLITAYVDENGDKKFNPEEKYSECVISVIGNIAIKTDVQEIIKGNIDNIEVSLKYADDSVTWESEDKNIITVTPSTNDGTNKAASIHANNYGSTKVIATSSKDKKHFVTFDITVCSPHVSSLNLSNETVYLGKDGTDTMVSGIVNTFGDADKTISWSISDSSIASLTVDSENNAHLKGLNDGTTELFSKVGGVGADGVDYTITKSIPVTVGDYVPANDAYSFVGQTKERLEILGKLENYATKNHITGITLMGDGAMTLYQDNISLGSDTFITGYGFGELQESTINADLPGESNPNWKRYLHTFLPSDPVNINYIDDKTSTVGDINSYVSSPYYGNYMNSDKDGYDWKGILATDDMPIPVNPTSKNGEVTATKYKVHLKVGKALQYSTYSSIKKYARYNNTTANIEDYVTTFQILYTQKYNLARSAENLTGLGSIKGTEDYYIKSAEGFNEEAWKDVGIKAGSDDLGSYLEFEFNLACSPFYAMYYLSSTMYAPVPKDFILDLGDGDLTKGVRYWGKSNESGTETPMDHWLSAGPYVLEAWHKGQEIVFKKNHNWTDPKHYKLAGIHVNILAAQSSDTTAAIKEWESGKLTYATVPTTYVSKYKGDSRVRMMGSKSNYKLNINTCDKEMWEKLFGENGTVTQTPKSQYWEVEPAMHNKDFVDGISYAINREEFADKRGKSSAYTYFSDNYLSDTYGTSYNSTQEHKDAVAPIFKGTKSGYSLEKAKASFKRASDKLIADGIYKAGDTIHIEIAWMLASDKEEYHNDIAAYIKTAFEGSGSPLNIVVDFWSGAVRTDVYFSKMKVGQFDIGYGGVSGNELDPLNFLEILKSDNSSDFTLNWGVDTNAVDGTLIYDNKAWSFDALWASADHGCYVENGTASSMFTYISCNEVKRDSEGNLVFKIATKERHIREGDYAELGSIALFAYTEEDQSDYQELVLERYDGEGKLSPNWIVTHQEGTDFYNYEISFSLKQISDWITKFPQDKVLSQGLKLNSINSIKFNISVSFETICWMGVIPSSNNNY